MPRKEAVAKLDARDCQHKCHRVGLNPWVKNCPVCGCPNPAFDPRAKGPMKFEDWIAMMDRLEGKDGPLQPV